MCGNSHPYGARWHIPAICSFRVAKGEKNEIVLLCALTTTLVSSGVAAWQGYDYERIFGANCEIVCGYIPIPVGIVGPLMLNGQEVYVPMATTEVRQTDRHKQTRRTEGRTPCHAPLAPSTFAFFFLK